MLGKFFQKPDPELNDRVPPGQHLAKGFPVLTYGQTPQVSTDGWEFKVWGLATPKTLTWDDFMAMPQSHFTADFHCVTTWSKLDVQWTGVKVTDLMQQVELEPTAVHVMQHCYGGYTTNLTMEDFLREENFFAHTVFGEPLPAEHGGPMRLVVPHLYAWKSAKWINGLEFLDHMELGFWERNGYHHRGEPFAEERYSSRF
ncbi:MAG: sulfite oxidase-like oxidoreductase [Cyanobacteria bacterium RM1_2_2]|nr:sulfite oxidase-like oxidoreductase [Cyanobacteria bacterium RM1_2_2]